MVVLGFFRGLEGAGTRSHGYMQLVNLRALRACTKSGHGIGGARLTVSFGIPTLRHSIPGGSLTVTVSMATVTVIVPLTSIRIRRRISTSPGGRRQDG